MQAHNEMQRGEIEYLNGCTGPCRLWKRGGGYVSTKGGFTKDARKAAVYAGSGTAIAAAQRMGFAVVSW